MTADQCDRRCSLWCFLTLSLLAVLAALCVCVGWAAMQGNPLLSMGGALLIPAVFGLLMRAKATASRWNRAYWIARVRETDRARF